MSGTLYGLTLVAALSCGLVAGVFFAFSTFVMAALRQVAPAEGIRVMQTINRTVLTPLFMAPLFGGGLLCLGLGIWAVVSPDDDAAPWVLAGAALYVVGTVGVTMVANVPRNNALDALDPQAVDASARWRELASGWTAWNHVRTLAALAAAALFTVALTVSS
jgi:uncharacterized membrane protein